jgi:exosortase/archaeosortase
VLQSVVVAIVRACTRFASLVVVLGLLLSVGAGYYAARHFAINTDINSLISLNLAFL